MSARTDTGGAAPGGPPRAVVRETAASAGAGRAVVRETAAFVGVVRAVVREAVASAVAARVASVLTVTVVAVLCAVVLLTTGRTVGAQNAIVASIDSAATRSVIVRAPASSGLDTTVLDRLAHSGGVASATAFGPADDVVNAAFPGGQRVSLRAEYSLPVASGTPPTAAGGDAPASASPAAGRALGLADGIGAVASVATGAAYDVLGVRALPDYLRFLDPVVLVPERTDDVPTPAAGSAPHPVSVLVVVATSSAQVEAVAALVTSVLGVTSRDGVTVTTSAALTALRGSVQAQLGEFSRSFTLLVFGVGGVAVAAVLYGLVLLRRRDFGRRRALGASRSLIVALLLAQVAVLGTAGSAVGCLGAAITLLATGDPLPTVSFIAAVAPLSVLTALAASVAPALIASTREPLRELRVP
ncbi:FtsX-like permease family protein [Subtercola sp. YIM 133946]|uniref:FtsX-like permease family protein n=1 Tax=Subtercola sp. YIM 133946 TaxID=3118909 RepID=UPI002F92FCDA